MAQSVPARNAEGIFMDVNPDAVLRAFRATGARRLIHGHTHRPAVHVRRGVDAPRRHVHGKNGDHPLVIRVAQHALDAATPIYRAQRGVEQLQQGMARAHRAPAISSWK